MVHGWQKKSHLPQYLYVNRFYKEVVGRYEGRIVWDTSKPNGTPRKLLDVSKLEKIGWHYRTELEDGIKLSYEDI